MTVAIDTASEFIECLRPSSDRWWNKELHMASHIFRGHSDASWGFVPSGLRPKSALEPLLKTFELLMRQAGHRDPGVADGAVQGRQREAILQYALAEAAYQFARLARDVGLPVNVEIPGSYLTKQTFKEGITMPPPVPLDLLAMAQHHGVPTRLLDWTLDPLSAAYFAAGNGDESTDLCVWALTTSITRFNTGMAQLTLSWPSTGGNEFLRAQMGAFLGTQSNEELRASDMHVILPHCTGFTLPAGERMHLRELLFRERRSLAHIMPSWDNVASTTRDNWAYYPK